MITNRIKWYEPGWIEFLRRAGLVSDRQARKAEHRVSVEIIRELERRAKRRKRQ